MVREQITVQDYERISRENEYYLWHFVRKSDTGITTVYSIFDEKDNLLSRPNDTETLLDAYNIPYFESYIEDSLDFLDMIVAPLNSLRIREKNMLNTFMLTFNKRRLINATYNGYCMCVEGITELLYDLNPEIVLNAKLD